MGSSRFRMKRNAERVAYFLNSRRTIETFNFEIRSIFDLNKRCWHPESTAAATKAGFIVDVKVLASTLNLAGHSGLQNRLATHHDTREFIHECFCARFCSPVAACDVDTALSSACRFLGGWNGSSVPTILASPTTDSEIAFEERFSSVARFTFAKERTACLFISTLLIWTYAHAETYEMREKKHALAQKCARTFAETTSWSVSRTKLD